MVMEIKRQMFHAVKLIVGHDKELENIKFIRKREKFILKLYGNKILIYDATDLISVVVDIFLETLGINYKLCNLDEIEAYTKVASAILWAEIKKINRLYKDTYVTTKNDSCFTYNFSEEELRKRFKKLVAATC